MSDNDGNLSDEILALVDGVGSSVRPSRKESSRGGSSHKAKSRRARRGSDSDGSYESDDAYEPAARTTTTWRGKNHSTVDDDAAHDDDLAADDGELDDAEGSWGSDLMGGEKDREYLESLPELEREKILSERAEKRQMILEQKALRRKLRESYRISGEVTRRSEKVKSEKMRKLEALKGKREETRRNTERKRRHSSSSGSDLSDLEPTEEEESRAVQQQRRQRSDSPHVSTPTISPPQVPERARAVVTLNELCSMQLTRDNIEKWCFASFFHDVGIDAFVRVRIGTDSNGVPQYRAAQIKEISQYKRPYVISKVKTNLAFILKHGKAEKLFLADIFSNSPFTQGEYDRWRVTCEHEHATLPSSEDAQEKASHLAQAAQHIFSDAEITEILKKKRELAAAPRNLASEKSELLRRRDVAASAGRTQEVQELDSQIEALKELADEQRRAQIEREQQLARQVSIGDRGRKGRPGGIRQEPPKSTATPAAQAIDSWSFISSIPRTAGDTAPDETMTFQELFASGPKLEIDL